MKEEKLKRLAKTRYWHDIMITADDQKMFINEKRMRLEAAKMLYNSGYYEIEKSIYYCYNKNGS